MTSKPHDALFRAIFGLPCHAAAELRAVLPAAVVAELDLETLTPLDGSFVDEELRAAAKVLKTPDPVVRAACDQKDINARDRILMHAARPDVGSRDQILDQIPSIRRLVEPPVDVLRKCPELGLSP